MGQPVNGFSKQLQDIILKGQQPLTERPGEYLKPVEFDEIREQLQDKNYGEVTPPPLILSVLSPPIFFPFLPPLPPSFTFSFLPPPPFFFL
ncbi:hypothetical protein, partial [Staphylococcus gallinarum]|uniref:hypothetical protein n=1 Tax=Staphylococcus gallinarum TaxID=1293 RepID=UPI003BA9AB77